MGLDWRCLAGKPSMLRSDQLQPTALHHPFTARGDRMPSDRHGRHIGTCGFGHVDEEHSMKFRKGLLATALVAAFIAPVHAANVALSPNGQWNPFAVDDLVGPSYGTAWIDTETLSPSYGETLNYTFTIAPGDIGMLTIVDAGFAGDTFNVTNLGSSIGATSSVAATTFDTAPNAGADYDAALANASFSRGVFTLGAGSYSISGSLLQSVTLDGTTPLNATAGALKLDVSPVPESGSLALMLAGFGVLAFVARRRAA
jgi:hypothetical protein